MLNVRLAFTCLVLFVAGCGPGTAPGCDPACAAGERCTASGCEADVDMAVAEPRDMAPACSPPCQGAAPYCNANRVCVPCLVDEQCPAGKLCRSTPNSATCVPGCNDDARCNGAAGDGGAGGPLKCCGGQCLDVTSDAHNCGGCGTACMSSHTQSSCVGGACMNGMCSAGWADCNKDPMDGCESYLRVDAKNCGGCGMACEIKNAVAGCAGTCYLRACNFGYDDCNGDLKDGCETAVVSDAKNCGGCGQVCKAVANAKSACINAACTITGCNQGFADCDGKPANGCETAVGVDKANCGACGNVCGANLVCVNGGCTCQQCNIPNARTKCVNNQCVFDQCLAGYADCNNNVNDGCEVNLNGDANNCSACGMACPMNKRVCVNAGCTDVPVNPFFNSMLNQTGSTTRGAGAPCGTLLTANQNVQVVALAVNVKLPAQGNIKFMIWTHPQHQLVYVTPPKLFQAGTGWMQSDPFPPFMMQAGQSYDIGGTSDIPNVIYYYDQVKETMGGVTSLSQNPNWSNYAMPVFGGHAAVDCGVELF